ncbi:MAG: creatininase family protein [Candidatus Bathyarchaeia archaeon]
MVRWEDLTSKDIAEIDKSLPVVIPIGSVEVHGPHLPLGTDIISIYWVAVKASELENAIILPPIAYGYAPESKHFSGTISISAETILSLLREVCLEVYRNGFRKIIILNGHGGNTRILRLLSRDMLDRCMGICLYMVLDPWSPVRGEIERLRETERIGHACEIETSIISYIAPQLVKLDYVKGEAKVGIYTPIPNVETNVDWVGYALEAYLGDPRKASGEKGRIIVEQWVRGVAEIYRMVREDSFVEDTLKEYRRRVVEYQPG